MDILLSTLDGSFRIVPNSVHGILWLQTHFAPEHWESISSSQVTIPTANSSELANDALKAGITVGYVNSLSIKEKF